jgi:hypothetical protein
MNLPAFNPADRVAPHHYKEWLDSAIHPSLIGLNLQSFYGDEALQLVLQDEIANRQKVASYATTGAAKLTGVYQSLREGGWGRRGRSAQQLRVDGLEPI